MTQPTVLVVDDEPAILAMGRIILEREGYRVLTAEDGPAAVACFRAEPADAVVLDLNIPGLGGWAVLAELRRLRPGARVVVSTGSATHDGPSGSREAPTAVLPKPFLPADLVAVVARVLAAPA